MIYALKLLTVVFVVTCMAAYVFRPAFQEIFTKTEYRRVWRLVMLGVLASYLCHVTPVFMLAVACIAIYGALETKRGPAGKVAIYLLLACTLPPINLHLGGFGGVNYLLDVDNRRLDSMLLLSWAAIEIISTKSPPRSMRLVWLDILVVAYQVLRLALLSPQYTFTTEARAVVETILDVLLPYFVVTRGVRSMADLRLAGGHLLVGIAFAAAIGVTEAVLQHNLYSGLQSIYDVRWQQTYWLMRGNLIRVQATTPQPIVLAFLLLYGLGLGYWLMGQRWRRPAVLALFAAIMIAEIATFSRGPWLAMALVFGALVATRRLSATVLRIGFVAVTLVAVGLKLADADQQVVTALGAIFGSDEANLASIQYRRELLDTSLALIKQSPWLGVPNYAAQMQNLRQGEGIIDLVNSYVGILLNSGTIGLVLYLLPFLIVMNRLLSAIRRDASGAGQEGNRFAIAAVSLILGSLFAILTTSTWGVMTLLMTALVALPAAWLCMSPEERNAAGPRADIELDIPDDPLQRHAAWVGGRLS